MKQPRDGVTSADPRLNPGHRERGPARFTFTYQDIADLTGMTVAAVRNAASATKRVPAELNPRDLASVVRFIVARQERALRRALRREVRIQRRSR
jgi:hypothetical protein